MPICYLSVNILYIHYSFPGQYQHIVQKLGDSAGIQQIALGANPSDITAALGYLLDAPSVTGQMINVDGGQHLAWQTPDVVGLE